MKLKEYKKIAKLNDVVKYKGKEWFVYALDLCPGISCFRLMPMGMGDIGCWSKTINLRSNDIESLEDDKFEIFLSPYTYNAKTNKLNNNIMGNFINTFKRITRTEPEKTFVKAGFMDEQENLTEDGVSALQYILWEENKEKLKELANKIISENDKNIIS